MNEELNYRKARKTNAIFLLLLLGVDQTSGSGTGLESDKLSKHQEISRSPEYFEEKLKEFERDKYRF